MRKILIYIIVSIIPVAVFGQQYEFSKYAGEFLRFSAGARASGVGGAFTALADDGFTSYWNPAGLTQLNMPQLFLMHSSRFGGEVKYDFLGYSFPGKNNNSYAFSILRIGIDDIPDTRNALLDFGLDNIPGSGDEGENNGQLDGDERIDPKKVTFFANTDYVFFLSYAKKRTDNLSLGFSAKIIKRKIGENDAWGIGFDASALKCFENLRIGMVFRDITTTLLSWDTGKNELITPSARFGFSYSFLIEKLSLKFRPVFELINHFEGREYSAQFNLGKLSFDIQYGVEFEIFKKLYLRTGMDEIKRFSVGTGFNLPNLRLDYSFTSFNKFDQLGNLHRISVLIDIDKKLFKK